MVGSQKQKKEPKPSYEELTKRLQQLELKQKVHEEEQTYTDHMRQMLNLLRTMNRILLEETDQRQLITSTCKAITEVPGYLSVWAALTDTSLTKVMVTASSGLDDTFLPLRKQLLDSQFPTCMRKALESNSLVVINAETQCTDCPLSKITAPCCNLVKTLNYGQDIYGVLVVSTTSDLMHLDEAQYIFSQVAADLAMALHRLERKEYLRYIDNIFTSIPHPMCLVSKDLRYLLVNNKYAELYQSQPDDFIGSSPRDFFGHEVFENEIRKNLDRCLSGKAVRFESLTDFPQKGPTWMEVSYFPFHDQRGDIVGILTHRMDITERKLSEIKLRKSEERFVLLSDASIEALFFISDDSCIDANLTATKMFGYETREFLGQDCTEIITGGNNAKLKKAISSSADLRLEVDGVRRDGTVFPMVVRTRTMPYKNNLEVRVLSILDVTDKVQSEEALLLTEHSLEQIDSMVFWLTEEGTILKANNSTCQRLGYSKNEFDAVNLKKVGFELLIHEREKHWEQLKKKKKLINQTTCSSRSGDFFPVELESHYLEFHNNQYEVIIAIDITERKKVEQIALQSQKMDALTTLAGGIAHDFNNILSSILGFTEFAKSRVTEDEQTSKMLDQVLDSGLAARKLVKQILAFSRTAKFQKSNLFIVPLMKECLKNFTTSRRSIIRTRTSFFDEDIALYADPVQMHQMFMHLLSNGYRAMEKEGGDLFVSISVKNLFDSKLLKRIGIPAGRYVELIVKDTGCGIPETVKEKMFEPFFSTRSRGESTGMGLSVVYGIVQEMQGQILVESELGNGSLFTVYIPEKS